MASQQVDGGMGTLRISSAQFAGPDGIEASRENFGRAVMRLEIDPIPGFPFEFDFDLCGLAEFGMASGRISPTRNRHTATMIDNDDVILVYAPQGSGTLRQFGREVSIQDGDAVLVSNGSVGEFLGHAPSFIRNLRFSRAMLSPLVANIEDTMIRKIPRNHPALRLLASYVGIIKDSEALATPDLRRSIALHMHDLASLIVGATRDAAEIVKGRGARAARLRAIKADIIENITDRGLTIGALAGRHGISARSIRALFAGEETTFADFVLNQRLARVYRHLTDPRFADRAISGIAFESGFGDLSYFNHAFRRRYQVTPSDVRAAARREA
ncbi:helix-turn-helix domain-containing protein [Mesorhizobium sp. BAC0120]|uniref:helix-turn-helix domain-containing protein n=1 Tax=Mesorhizobium sp. BAC0120 TaxID=3090670 RepID=UPI00298CA2E7|nr:helix-turn-helix domain-containing protein [Mesorhizobium sp. BAC0120]MDW6023708.1 helix-turn-helix domain-containing protein [Mesorhizobium sp. BAC0120]